jgi:hypothetical protein
MQTFFRFLTAAFAVLGLACSATAFQEATSDDLPSLPQLNTANDQAAAPLTLQQPVESNPSADGENGWRYRQHEGRWWYWLPSNRWVMWDDGRWIDPPAESIPSGRIETPQYESGPRYVVPAPSPAARLMQPRPRSWYYSGGVYDGPRYYYDEFYSPYGGARPYSYYPVPRPYPGPGYYGRYGGYPYGYGRSGVGVSIGSGGYGTGVRIGIGF